MAERDYAELVKQYALGKTIQRQHFSRTTWYDLNENDFDENGNIKFDDRDGYRVKPSTELNYGLISITMFVLNCIRRAGFSCKNTCAKVQDGIIRIKDGDDVWRITITKE